MSIRPIFGAAFTAMLLALSCPAPADTAKRAPAGKLFTESGTVLARPATEQPWNWTPLVKGKGIPSDDQLIGLENAVIESLNGAVRLTTRTDLTNRSPFPIIETAVRLNVPGKDVDLDLWLDRGRVDISNVKQSGSARVVIRFRERVWDLVLEKPGTRLAMEIYGRWPRGAHFNPKPEPGTGPLTSVLLIVLKGEVQRSCSLCSVHMTAPPGPSQFGWDNITGDDRGATKLEKLPDWAKEPDANSPEVKLAEARREAFRQTVMSKGLGEALVTLLEAKDPHVRRIGIYALGAFDQIPSLRNELMRSHDFETWNNAVIALRHWLGRGPGQEVKLHEALLKKRDFTPIQARNVLQMLMGFTDELEQRPELYSVLIDSLKSDQFAIRGLAYWHLLKLAPGVKVTFDPNSDEAGRERAWKAYKDQIPTGKLPPPVKLPEDK